MSDGYKTRIPAIAMATLALALSAACATAGLRADASSPAEAPSPEGYWLLVSLRGEPIAEGSANPPTLRLEGGSAGGTGGCNSWGASYTLGESGLIRFSELWSTKMACEDMGLESRFYEALSASRSWSVSGCILVLADGVGAEVAAFAAAR